MEIDLTKIKCVVFDADNTLYSTKKVAKDADMAAMKVLGEATGKKSEDLYTEFLEIVKTVKDSPDPKIRHRKYSYGKLCAKYEKDLINKMYAAFEEVLIDKIELVPGIMNQLAEMENKELYVVTEDNREMAIKKLTKLSLLNKFKSVTTSDEAGIMKPSKNYYSEVLSKFKPEEILVIGDNYEKDLALPEELGMKIRLV